MALQLQRVTGMKNEIVINEKKSTGEVQKIKKEPLEDVCHWQDNRKLMRSVKKIMKTMLTTKKAMVIPRIISQI